MSTVNNAKYTLKLFLQSVYGEGDLEGLAKKYIEDKPDPRKDIQAFFSEIKNRPPASIRVLISHIKTFLIENQFEIPQRFWRRLSRRIKGGNIARTRDRIPTNEELTQGQAGLAKEVEEIRTTLFGKSFGDLVKSSIETINDVEKKEKAKKKENSEAS